MVPILRKNIACLFLYDASYAYHRIISSSFFFFYIRLLSTSKKGDLVASPAIRDILLHKYQFSPQSATESAAILNRLKDPKKSELVLSVFKEYGFSISKLEKLVKMKTSTRLLSSSPDNIKLKFKVLQDLGFPSDGIVKLISGNISILFSNLNTRVIPSFSRLKGLLGTTDAAVKLCKRTPWLLSCDLESTIAPNIDFLKSYGIPDERILKLLFYDAVCFMVNPAAFKKFVKKAEEMGASRNSNMFIYAILSISKSPDDKWELKVQDFQNCGFSASDIVKMFRKAPPVFSISTEKLRQVKDFLLANGKYSLSCIINSPTSLAYSIEDRYRPRFKVLETLESKKLIENWPHLSSVSRMTDREFFEKFVGPYLDEVGQVYIAKSYDKAKGKN